MFPHPVGLPRFLRPRLIPAGGANAQWLGVEECRFSRSSTGCFSRMFVMGRTQFSGLGDTLIGEGAVA